MINAVKLAKIGLTMETGTILKWLKAEGDFVQQDDPLLEVETDKSVNTVDSFYTGYLKKILVQEGEEVPVETVIAYIGEKDDEVPAADEGEDSRSAVPTSDTDTSLYQEKEKATTDGQGSSSGPARINASPLARRLAAEMGVDHVPAIVFNGKKGRIF